MLFYLMVDKEGRTIASPYPDIDRAAEDKLPSAEWKKYLWPGMPLYYMETVRKRIPEKGVSEAQVSKALKQSGLGEFDWKWMECNPGDNSYSKPFPGVYQQLGASVRGRCVSEREMRVLATETSQKMEEIQRTLHRLVLEKDGLWCPAVDHDHGGWICQRCGGRECQEWPGIYGVTATCLHCGMLGGLTSLQVLYQDLRTVATRQDKVDLLPRWELTEAQKQASGEVLHFVQGRENKALLWAACGAGKTEVCFPAVAWALRQGQSVLFAAPRQDVIHDIAPRVRDNFPGIKLQVLTGISEIRFQPGDVVMATTHQLLRFNHAFNFIILDEMDAFPYAGNEMLQWGLTHALAENGKLLYLTATPVREELAAARSGRFPLIHLPARHHHRALPVPVWERWQPVRDENGMELCPPPLQNMFNELAKRGTILVFVPKISLVEIWVNKLRSSFANWAIDGSCSQDPLRQEKITKLKAGSYHIFVSTSILERGVTVPGVQVVVLFADHDIFNERTLVQMAGRVGRTKRNPEGTVIFYAPWPNKAIKMAIKQIEELNALARNRGLLDDDGGTEC